MKPPLRGWRLLLFARCDHASQVDSDEWDGPVEADRWWAARLHRLACRPCRRRRRRMQWLRRILSAAPEAAPASLDCGCAMTPRAAERIRSAVAAEVGNGDSDFSQDSL